MIELDHLILMLSTAGFQASQEQLVALTQRFNLVLSSESYPGDYHESEWPACLKRYKRYVERAVGVQQAPAFFADLPGSDAEDEEGGYRTFYNRQW